MVGASFSRIGISLTWLCIVVPGKGWATCRRRNPFFGDSQFAKTSWPSLRRPNSTTSRGNVARSSWHGSVSTSCEKRGPHSLGGEKRRLTIARSLVTEPSLLMLDEPFSGVDPIAVYDVQQIIQDLRAQGLAILITDHNVRETLNIVDRAYLIFEGRVESQGTKDFLLNDPISRKLYLGENFQM